MLKYICLFFSVTLLLCACKGKAGKAGIIPEDEMINLLVDVHIVDGSVYSAMSQVPDSLYKYDMGRFVVLFNRYHIDTAQFRKSLRYYAERPTEMANMYVVIMGKLQEKTDSLNTGKLKNFNKK
jgi:hypothetical protein